MTASAAAARPSVSHTDMANAIRALSMDAVQKANSGHPGMPMGMADVATVLFRDFLKFNPKDPEWADRDRFILSAGHGSMLLYSLLYLTGYEDMTIEDIQNFRQLHAKTCGHPEYGEAAGIETTTGPLGQGLGNAVGMALAEAMLQARYGNELVDHYTYAIAGDGCLMEGISQEAITLAGHLGLHKLIVLFDDNEISIDGPTSLATSEDQLKRFEAAGWDVQAIDGHDERAIKAALEQAKTTDTPSMIACKTTIGYGAPTKAGTAGSHGAPLGDDEIRATRERLGWQYAPFEVPEDILQSWREAGTRSLKEYDAWQQRLEASSHKTAFLAAQAGNVDEKARQAVKKLKQQFAGSEKMATRKSSGDSLQVLTEAIPELIGGSADLTGSNLTKSGKQQPVSKDNYAGSYIYYGVREHAMCAAMNGVALHKGLIPYGGTFFVFTDYCRPAIRLAALMKQRAIYVMTHDSIGLGEDGPTHQPVEHLASLRAMPNLQLLRPADATEVAEAWELALTHKDGPTMLVLSRQGLPSVRNTYMEENLSAKGGYILSESEGEAEVTLIATGSEVEIALETQAKLKEHGVAANVVSMPSTGLFDQQPERYRKQVLGEDTLKVAIEAGSPFGWEKYIGQDGIFIGMEGFGGSAPAGDLYRHFGITAENALAKILETLKQ